MLLYVMTGGAKTEVGYTTGSITIVDPQTSEGRVGICHRKTPKISI